MKWLDSQLIANDHEPPNLGEANNGKTHIVRNINEFRGYLFPEKIHVPALKLTVSYKGRKGSPKIPNNKKMIRTYRIPLSPHIGHDGRTCRFVAFGSNVLRIYAVLIQQNGSNLHCARQSRSPVQTCRRLSRNHHCDQTHCFMRYRQCEDNMWNVIQDREGEHFDSSKVSTSFFWGDAEIVIGEVIKKKKNSESNNLMQHLNVC